MWLSLSQHNRLIFNIVATFCRTQTALLFGRKSLDSMREKAGHTMLLTSVLARQQKGCSGLRLQSLHSKRQYFQGHASGKQVFQDCLLLKSYSHKKKKKPQRNPHPVETSEGVTLWCSRVVTCLELSPVIVSECWRQPDVLLESPHLDLITLNGLSWQALCY